MLIFTGCVAGVLHMQKKKLHNKRRWNYAAHSAVSSQVLPIGNHAAASTAYLFAILSDAVASATAF